MQPAIPSESSGSGFMPGRPPSPTAKAGQRGRSPTFIVGSQAATPGERPLVTAFLPNKRLNGCPAAAGSDISVPATPAEASIASILCRSVERSRGAVVLDGQTHHRATWVPAGGRPMLRLFGASKDFAITRTGYIRHGSVRATWFSRTAPNPQGPRAIARPALIP